MLQLAGEWQQILRSLYRRYKGSVIKVWVAASLMNEADEKWVARVFGPCLQPYQSKVPGGTEIKVWGMRLE